MKFVESERTMRVVRCNIDEWRIDRFRRMWAVFAFLLLTVTWRLWTPQAVYPQIPLMRLLVQGPAWIDWVALVSAGSSLLVAAFARKATVYRAALLFFVAAALVLVMLDQHRLQPWVYQFVVLAIIMAGCPARQALKLIRLLAASIYIYSAVSKFDYQFMHTLGREFLSTLLGYVGLHSENWPHSVELSLIVALPVGELLVGLGLLVPQTRRIAAMFAIVLHVSLLLILGPWGLGHKAGVLIWNLFFIEQAWRLFLARGKAIDSSDSVDASDVVDVTRTDQPADSSTARLAELGATITVWFVLLFPLTAAFGLCDHWPAWELYSPRSSRAQVYVHETARTTLPADLQQHLIAVQGDDQWQRLRIDQWSLDELDAPIYPQDRFQIAVALAIAQRYELDRSVRVLRQSASDRFTGERSEQMIVGTEQLKIAAERFRLNTLARTRKP